MPREVALEKAKTPKKKKKKIRLRHAKPRLVRRFIGLPLFLVEGEVSSDRRQSGEVGWCVRPGVQVRIRLPGEGVREGSAKPEPLLAARPQGHRRSRAGPSAREREAGHAGARGAGAIPGRGSQTQPDAPARRQVQTRTCAWPVNKGARRLDSLVSTSCFSSLGHRMTPKLIISRAAAGDFDGHC